MLETVGNIPPHMAATQGRRKWPSIHYMAPKGHNPAALDSARVVAFIQSLRPDADTMARDTGIKFGTVEKWYRKKPIEPSAVNFLRVVLALQAEQELTDWLEGIAKGRHLERQTYQRVSDLAEKRAKRHGS